MAFGEEIRIFAKDRATPALVKAGKSTKKLGEATQKAGQKMRRSFRGVGTSVSSLTGSIFSLRGGVVALAGAFGIGVLGKGLLDTAAKFETLEITLTSLEGSSAKARRSVKWIEDFTQNTPFQLDGVTSSFIKMKAFGLEPTNGSMQALADQAALLGGKQETLEGIVNAVGQAWAKQKLQGEEILQLVERGVPVWSLLEKALGKNTKEIQKLSEQGRLGRKEITLLLNELGESTKGAALAQIGTWTGMISNLGDQWTKFNRLVSESGAFDAIKKGIGTLLTAISDAEKTGRLADIAEKTGVAIVNAMEVGVKSVVVLKNTFSGLRVTLLAAERGVLLIGDAFDSINLKVSEFGLSASEAVNFFGTEDASIIKKKQSINSLKNEIQQTSLRATELKNEMIELSVGISNSTEITDRIFSGLREDLKTKKDLISGEDQTLGGSGFPTKEVIPEGTSGPIDLTQELLGQEILRQAQIDFAKDEVQRFKDKQERIGQAILENAQFAFSIEEAKELAFGERQERIGQAILDNAQFNREIKEAEVLEEGERQERLGRMIQKRAAFELAQEQRLQKGKEAARKRDFKTAINLSNALFIFGGQKSKKIFKITKALNLAEATTSGISAIQKAWSALPFPANLPGVASTTAGVALNISKIKATRFGGGGGVGGGIPSGGGTPLIGATPTGADLNSALDRTNQRSPGNVNVIINQPENAPIDLASISETIGDFIGGRVEFGSSFVINTALSKVADSLSREGQDSEIQAIKPSFSPNINTEINPIFRPLNPAINIPAPIFNVPQRETVIREVLPQRDLSARLDVPRVQVTKIFNTKVEGNLVDLADLTRKITEAEVELALDTI